MQAFLFSPGVAQVYVDPAETAQLEVPELNAHFSLLNVTYEQTFMLTLT